jgi:polar amino acid transport system substrate-binding protein
VKTKTAGKLTIATDQPAYEPWMVDNDPTNGKGYESAVAYAVAGKLGFSKDQVSWVRVKFNTAISPAP